jgi:hypothetical protein
MRLIILDAESYYDREFNLRRMDPASYILDPRFELIGIAVKEPGVAAYWVEGPDAPAFFASLDPNDIMSGSHNALFDNCIWFYRYGFVPRLMVDTLGVSRAVLSLKSNSLESVAEHLQLGAKGEEIYQANGMRLADLKARPEFYCKYINYAMNDATRGHLRQISPHREIPLRGAVHTRSGSEMCCHPDPACQRADAPASFGRCA